MLSKKERQPIRDRITFTSVITTDDMDTEALLDTCDELEAERDKLSKCLERLGFVPGATEAELLIAVEDYNALAYRNADERIEAMAERDRLHDEAETLRAMLAEYKRGWQEIMDEPCPESDDRRHCTCVPALRIGIQELKAERDAANETLEAFMAGELQQPRDAGKESQ